MTIGSWYPSGSFLGQIINGKFHRKIPVVILDHLGKKVCWKKSCTTLDGWHPITNGILPIYQLVQDFATIHSINLEVGSPELPPHPADGKPNSCTRKLKQPQVPPIASNPVESSPNTLGLGLGDHQKWLNPASKRVVKFGARANNTHIRNNPSTWCCAGIS